MPSSPTRRRSAAAVQPTTVLLVRHGATPTTGKMLPGRAPGLHLSEQGQAQAQRVAAAIGELKTPPVAIYASPLERTRQTAAAIARALGLRVQTERDLIELDVGAWTGISLKRAASKPEWATVQRWPSAFRFPEGESFSEMSTRASDAVLRIVAAHPGATVVAVSHADPIRAIVARFTGVPMDLFQRITVGTCSVSVLAFHREGPRLMGLNISADGLVRQ